MSMAVPRRTGVKAKAKAKPARARGRGVSRGWSSGFLSLLAVVVVLGRRARYVHDGLYALMPVLAAFGACAVLVMAQPDMGTTLVMGFIVFAVLFVGGVRLRSMAALFATGAFGAFVLGMLEPYRR